MVAKYELTDQSIRFDGKKLYRIRALQDFSDVHAGDLGGFVENERNLSHHGLCWIYDDAKAYAMSRISNNARLKDYAICNGRAKVYGNSLLSGKSEISNSANIFDHAIVLDESTVSGNSQIFGHAILMNHAKVFENGKVYGHAMISDYGMIFDNGSVYDCARVRGNGKIFENASAYGNAEIYENASLCGDGEICDHAKLCGEAMILGKGYLEGEVVASGKTRILASHDLSCYPYNIIFEENAPMEPGLIFSLKELEKTTSKEYSLEEIYILYREHFSDEKTASGQIQSPLQFQIFGIIQRWFQDGKPISGKESIWESNRYWPYAEEVTSFPGKPQYEFGLKNQRKSYRRPFEFIKPQEDFNPIP